MKTLLAALGCAALLAGCATAPSGYYSYGYSAPYAYGYDYGPYYGPYYYGPAYYDYGPTLGFSYYSGHYRDGSYHHYDRQAAYNGDHWRAATSSASVGRVTAPTRTYVTAAPRAQVANAPRHASRSNAAATRAQHQRPSVAHARAPEHDRAGS